MDTLPHCPFCGVQVEFSHLATCPSNPKKDLTMTKKQDTVSALDIQIAGSHYKGLKIQPAEYIHANNMDWFEGNVVKYVTRWKLKGGITDLEKARHYIDLLIELERKELIASKENIN